MAAMLALALVCFGRLIMNPAALLVDGRRVSIDYANPGDPRPIGNDLTFFFLPHHMSIGKVISEFGHLPFWDARGFGGRPLIGNPQAGVWYPPVWAVWWGAPSALGWLTVGHLLWGGLGVYRLMRLAAAGRWAATVAAGVYLASPFLLAHTFEGHYPHVWAASWYPWAFWAFGQARRGHARGLLILPVAVAMTFLAGHPQEWLLLVLALSAWGLADVFSLWRAGTAHRRDGKLRSMAPGAPRCFVAHCSPPYDGGVGGGRSSLVVRMIRRLQVFKAGTPPASPSQRGETSERERPHGASETPVRGTPVLDRRGPLFINTGAHRASFRLLVWACAAVLSLGLVAVDLVPQLTVRPWLLRDHDALSRLQIPRRYHLQSLNGFQLLSPFALGGPADYFGDDNYWEALLAMGFVPLLLATLAVMRHPNRRLVRGWLALVGLAVWFACGRHLLLYSAAYLVIPGVSSFRVPARSLFLANLGGAVLAGLGVQTLASRLSEPRAWRQFAIWSGVALLLVILSLYLVGHARRPDHFSRTGAAARRVLTDGCFQLAFAGVCALLLLGCVPFSSRGPRLAGSLIGLLALCELGWQGNSLLQVAPVAQFVGADSVSEALQRLEAGLEKGGRVRIKARDNYYGDLPAVCHGFEKTNVNDVFQIDHAAQLYETVYPVASRRRRTRDDLMNEPVEDFHRQVRQSVFDRMSVSHVISDRVESDPAWPVAATGAWNGTDFFIQSNRGRLPRAYVVPSAVIVPADERFDPGLFTRVDPRVSVLMDLDPLREVLPGPRQPFTPAEWIGTDPDHPVWRVTTVAPGLMVAADTWMPGWSARVDGSPVPVLRGNHAQQVIPLLGPGRHTVALEYRPPGLAAGCAITTVSAVLWALLAGLAVFSRGKARRPPRRRRNRKRNASARRASGTAKG